MHDLKSVGAATPAEASPDDQQRTNLVDRLSRLGRSAYVSRIVPFIALGALIIVFSILAPSRFPTFSNAQYIAVQSIAIMIVAFGATLVIISGSIDLSVGSVVALSAMSGALTASDFGPVIGLLVAILTGALAGLFNGIGLAYLRIPSFIMTLGMLSIARGLTLVISGTQPVRVPESWRGMGSSPGIYIVALTVLLVGIVLYRLTAFGRYVAAIGGSERVALMSGVPVRRMKLLVFVLGGVCAAVGGLVLSARVGAATPTAGTGLELTVIAAVVLGGTPLTGGIGSLVNTAVGALIITILLNGLVILGVGAEMQIIAQGLVLVVAVLISLDRRKIGIIK